MKCLKPAAAFATALILAGGPASAQLRLTGTDGDVLVFRATGQVQVVEEFALNAGEAEALAAFQREARYYGALYVDPTDGDNSMYMIDLHSLDTAEALAQASCAEDAGDGKRCVLYARAVPTGYPTSPRRGDTLSESATEDFFTDFVANTDSVLNGAFAVSGFADWVYYITEESHEALSAQARTECEASAKAGIAGLPPAMQSLADSQLLARCRVIYLRYPSN